MAIKTDLNKALLDEVYGLYSDAENRMLERIASRVKRGVTDTGWTESKLADVQRLKRETESILGSTASLSKKKMSDSILGAYIKGAASASKDAGIPFTGLRGLIPPHLQRLILDTHQLVDTSGMQILRNAQDVYRKVIAETSTGVLMGVETRTAAAQEALNRFAAQGITGFTDKAGRRWDMGSYVDMAMRTTTSRAAIQGHLDRQAEIGNDLIRVSSIGTTCPICARWQGKVLSISGNDPKRPSLESAKADGLFHPNCKHTITAYFEDVPGWTPSEPPENNEALYNATQKQRYNERQIRKWKRVESVAMSPADKAKAASKVAQWQSIQRAHVADTGLRRKYGREGGASYTPNASRAKPERYRLKEKLDTGLPPGYTWEDYEKSIKKPDKPAKVVPPIIPVLPVIPPVVVPPPVVASPPPPPTIVQPDVPPPPKVRTREELMREVDEELARQAEKKAEKAAKAAKKAAKVDNLLDDFLDTVDDKVDWVPIFERGSGYRASHKPYKDYFDDVTSYFNRMNSSPTSKKYRKLLSLLSKKKGYSIVSVVHSDGRTGSFYSNSRYVSSVNFAKDAEAHVSGIRGKFEITFHESGHFVDDACGIRTTTRLHKALEEDYAAILSTYGDLEPGKLPDRSTYSMVSSRMRRQDRMLSDSIHTSGVHDTLSGLSLNKIDTEFAHETSYWKARGESRDGILSQVQSEFFATACASLSDPKQYAHMTRYFPKAMKDFEDLIDESLKNEAKKIMSEPGFKMPKKK